MFLKEHIFYEATLVIEGNRKKALSKHWGLKSILTSESMKFAN